MGISLATFDSVQHVAEGIVGNTAARGTIEAARARRDGNSAVLEVRLASTAITMPDHDSVFDRRIGRNAQPAAGAKISKCVEFNLVNFEAGLGAGDFSPLQSQRNRERFLISRTPKIGEIRWLFRRGNGEQFFSVVPVGGIERVGMVQGTVTDLARLRGLSTSRPRMTAMW